MGGLWWEGELMKETLPLMLCTYVKLSMAISVSYEEGEGVGREPGEAHQVLCACMSLSL